MKKIALIGAGLNGSIFIDALIAHSLSTDNWPHLTIVDHDQIEHRNSPGNHNIAMNVGVYKAMALVEKLGEYGLTNTRSVTQKLTKGNGKLILRDADIAIGAIDNVDGRLDIWDAARSLDVPYIDMGISLSGFYIGWAVGAFDTVQYSPNAMGTNEMPSDSKEAPCTLVGSRMHAAMAAECAAKSVMLFLYGHDPSGYVAGLSSAEPTAGDVLGWSGVSSVAETRIMPLYSGRV